MSLYESFESARVGDEVVVSFRVGFGHEAYKLASIDRLTKTQVIVGGQKFRRDTGGQVGGDSWYPNFIKHPTEKSLRLVEQFKTKSEMDREWLAICRLAERKPKEGTTLESLQKIRALLEDVVISPSEGEEG